MKWFEVAYTFLDYGGTYHCLSYGHDRDEAIQNFYRDGAGLRVSCLDVEEFDRLS